MLVKFIDIKFGYEFLGTKNSRFTYYEKLQYLDLHKLKKGKCFLSSRLEVQIVLALIKIIFEIEKF